MNPPVSPYPITEVFPNTASEGYHLFYDDPSLDAVMFNVNVGGPTAGWGAGSGSHYNNPFYDVGLMTAGQTYSSYGVDGGVIKDSQYTTSGIVVDLWRYGAWFTLTDPVVRARYTTSDQVYFGTVAAGVRTYPGVASRNAWSGYIQARDFGEPFLFEEWFSDNPLKQNQAVSFSGYTHFGDLSDPIVRVFSLGNPGEHVRKYVGGILKRTADSSNPDISDIQAGVMYTGGLSGGVAVVVLRGVVVRQLNYTAGAVVNINTDMDTAAEDDPSAFAGYPQMCDYLGISVNNDYIHINAYDEVGDDGYVENPNFDTYDVKFVSYVDRDSGLAPGVATGELWYLPPPMMYTHPGLPTVSVGFQNFWTSFVGQREYA
jgi:hypothetical protein